MQPPPLNAAHSPTAFVPAEKLGPLAWQRLELQSLNDRHFFPASIAGSTQKCCASRRCGPGPVVHQPFRALQVASSVVDPARAERQKPVASKMVMSCVVGLKRRYQEAKVIDSQRAKRTRCPMTSALLSAKSSLTFPRKEQTEGLHGTCREPEREASGTS